MEPLKILFLFLTYNEISYSLANGVQPFRNKSKRNDQFWVPKTPNNRRKSARVRVPRPPKPVHPPVTSYYAHSRLSFGEDGGNKYFSWPGMSPPMSPMDTMPAMMSPPSSSPSSDSDSSDSDSTNNKGKKLQVPQINFYNTVANSIGVIGQGYLWLREISNAIGTPLPMWVGCIPLLLLGIALMFLPDLTSLGLPLFYPNGAEGDPLGAFPPIPEITLPDINLGTGETTNMLEILGKILPPKLLSMRSG